MNNKKLNNKKLNNKEKFNDLIGKIFSPFIILFGYIKLFSETLFKYFKTHTEFVIVYTYGIGLLLQSLFLYFGFGIEGLNYLSIKFSIVILAILLFLGLLGIPIVLLVVISMFIVILLGLWWLLGLFIIFLIILKKFFPNLISKEKVKELDKQADKMYIISVFGIILTLSLSFFIQFGTPKPIELRTESNGKIIGKLLFYNQDYYFLESCGEQIILPAKEVNNIHMLCPKLKCTEDKLKIVNGVYKNYCNSLIKKNENK